MSKSGIMFDSNLLNYRPNRFADIRNYTHFRKNSEPLPQYQPVSKNELLILAIGCYRFLNKMLKKAKSLLRVNLLVFVFLSFVFVDIYKE